MCDDDGVCVCDDDGVPEADDDGVLVRDAEGVTVGVCDGSGTHVTAADTYVTIARVTVESHV